MKITVIGVAAAAVTLTVAGAAGALAASGPGHTAQLTAVAASGTVALPGAVAIPAPYFLNIKGAGTSLQINSAASGRAVATLGAPAGTAWDTDSATGYPRVFVLAAHHGGSPVGTDLTDLYRLRLTSTGKAAALTRVATVSAGDFDLQSAAGSPDGTRIAFPFNATPAKGKSYGSAQIDVLDVASGKITVFRSPTTGRIDDLTWSSDGTRLEWQIGGTTDHADGIWVLTPGHGGGLLASSHRVTRGLPRAPLNDVTVLSGNGADVFRLALQTSRGTKRVAVIETATATGKTVRTVFREPAATGAALEKDELGTTFARAGNDLLVVDGSGHAYRVALATGQVTRLPTKQSAPAALAW
jgi:hypothetical protein